MFYNVQQKTHNLPETLHALIHLHLTCKKQMNVNLHEASVTESGKGGKHPTSADPNMDIFSLLGTLIPWNVYNDHVAILMCMLYQSSALHADLLPHPESRLPTAFNLNSY